MGFSNQNNQQIFPYSAEEVFSALGEAVKMSNMSIKQSDSSLKRATISVGMSLLSWGETVSISVQSQDDNSCLVYLGSSLNFSANISGSHKHQKNFDKILYALSKVLSRGDHASESTDIVTQQENQLDSNGNKDNIFIVYVFIIAAVIILGIPTLIYLLGGGF